MRTRIRFTTYDGTPITFEAGGRRHTMDRVRCDQDRHSWEKALPIYRTALAGYAGISPDDIQIHLDPLTGPSATDAAELAALLGE